MDSSVDVFSGSKDFIKGSGLALENFFLRKPRLRGDKVQCCRDKIGRGILLTKDEDGVWLYNRTEATPIFVNSPTLGGPVTIDAVEGGPRPPDVHKISPGYSMLVYDYDKSRAYERLKARAPDGPFDAYSVSISFAKGFGKSYKRQDVVMCPCWLQVCLTRPTR